MLQGTNHSTYICKEKAPSHWWGAVKELSRYCWRSTMMRRPASRFLSTSWQVKRRLAKSQAFNEWTTGRCETSFRNCQEPVSNLKILLLMLNKIDDPKAVKLKNIDMISGSKLIWHGHLDVQRTSLRPNDIRPVGWHHIHNAACFDTKDIEVDRR